MFIIYDFKSSRELIVIILHERFRISFQKYTAARIAHSEINTRRSYLGYDHIRRLHEYFERYKYYIFRINRWNSVRRIVNIGWWQPSSVLHWINTVSISFMKRERFGSYRFTIVSGLENVTNGRRRSLNIQERSE